MAFLPALDLFLGSSIETVIDSSNCIFLFRIAISDCHSNIPVDIILLDLMEACQGVALSTTLDFLRLYWEFWFQKESDNVYYSSLSPFCCSFVVCKDYVILEIT